MRKLTWLLLTVMGISTPSFAQTSPCQADGQMVVAVGPNDLLKFSLESLDHNEVLENMPIVTEYRFFVKRADQPQGNNLATFTFAKEQLSLAAGSNNCYVSPGVPVPAVLNTLRDGKTPLIGVAQALNPQFLSDEVVSNPFVLAQAPVVLRKPRVGVLRVGSVSVTSVTRPSR